MRYSILISDVYIFGPDFGIALCILEITGDSRLTIFKSEDLNNLTILSDKAVPCLTAVNPFPYYSEVSAYIYFYTF